MNNRVYLAMALVALLPGAASAQFTTFVAPSHKAADSAKIVVASAARAAADTTRRTTLTNMKAWVDSAAAVAASPPLPGSPASPARDTTPRAATPRPSTPTTTFKNGAPAPATASALPLLALVGLAALSLGTVMLAGRDRA